MLDKIRVQMSALSKSERKVAQHILASPEQAIHSSIATLARAAEVSEPTVNRFCRHLGTAGFPDFKLQLAQALVKSPNWLSRDVQEDDSVERYSEKIFDSAWPGFSGCGSISILPRCSRP